MTKEEFDTLKVGDILTNKIDYEGKETGYDYMVTSKTDKMIQLNVIRIEDGYFVGRDEIEDCLDLRKKKKLI